MRLNVQNLKNGQNYLVEIDDNGTIDDLKVIISIESGIDPEFQVLIANNRPLMDDNQKAKAAGIKDNDLLMLSDQATLMSAAGQSNMFGGGAQANAGGNLLGFGGGNQIRQQPLAQPSANMNQNDANLLNSFFSDIQQQNFTAPTSARRHGGAGVNRIMGIPEPQFDAIIRQRVLETKQYYLANESQLNYILHQDREMAEAIVADDDQKLYEIVKKRTIEKLDRERKEKERLHRLANADILDIDAQREIEEEIQKGLIEENFQMAQENYPEFFGQITMLYINCKVNGHEIQAFVDSGAQSTIISQSLAEKIGLIKLMDKRYAGMAIGVGSSKILGRVHAADMDILGKKFVCSFTVLEDNKVDFLFGLDNLKRHQCCIDLVTNQLHLRNGEISIPFLSEGEIHKNEFEEEKQALLEKQKSMGSKHNEADIKELMEVTGCTKAQVEEALVINDGNKEHAATYLINQSKARSSPQRQSQ